MCGGFEYCDFSEISFVLYDPASDESFDGVCSEIMNLESHGYYSNFDILVSFPIDVSTTYYGEEFMVYACLGNDATLDYTYCWLENTEIINDTLLYYISEVADADGYIYFYGAFLKNSSDYTLSFRDVNGKIHNVPLIKDPYANRLKVKADDLCGVYTKGEDNYVYVEEDGVLIGKFDNWNFWSVGSVGHSFYADYSFQDHRYATVNLPSKLYTHYKLANSIKELKSKSFSPIENSVIYTLPDKGGKHVIYAQFMDANGNVSDITS